MTKQKLTCAEYLESVVWLDPKFHQLISEQYWSNGCNTEDLFDFMINSAKYHNIELTDIGIWGYDKPMHECYKSSNTIRHTANTKEFI